LADAQYKGFKCGGETPLVAYSDNMVHYPVAHYNQPGDQQFIYLFSILIKNRNPVDQKHQPG